MNLLEWDGEGRKLSWELRVERGLVFGASHQLPKSQIYVPLGKFC